MERFTGDVEQMRFHYTTQVRIRYGETDAMGYVYYGNYPLFMEVGRNELMRSLGFPYGRMESEGVMMPVVEMYVKYGTPARYDDLLNNHGNPRHSGGLCGIWLPNDEGGRWCAGGLGDYHIGLCRQGETHAGESSQICPC